MRLIELIDALLRHDALTARQWVADAQRENLIWRNVILPESMNAEAAAVAAGVVEMLASRAEQAPPSWTTGVGPAPRPVFLVKAAKEMANLRRLCETESPLPLRSRQIFAPPEFLKIA
jgi:hypothetical protein